MAEVRFHEGDRVGPGTVLARIDPDRYRLEAERAEATYQQAPSPTRARAAADLTRREELAQRAAGGGRGAEPRARRGASAWRRTRQAAKAARDIAAAEPAPRPRCGRPRAGVINTQDGRDRPVRQERARCSPPWSTPAGCACASRSPRASRCARAEGETVTLPRGAARRRATSTARIYHVGEVADPATRQVEVLAWVKNPGELKPGFFAEVTLASETHKGALVVPEGADPGQRAGLRRLRRSRAARRSCGRSRSACAPGRASSRSSPGVKAGETVVVGGLRPRSPTAWPSQPVARRRRGRRRRGAA